MGKTSNSRENVINSSKIPVILHRIDATCRAMEKQAVLLTKSNWHHFTIEDKGEKKHGARKTPKDI